MVDFLTASACRGFRPRSLDSVRLHIRSELLTRLMHERHVARFICAPDGFGKTSLASAYVQTVFSFEHCFWLDARNPCFLRDLDKDTLPEELVRRDRDVTLVVFDDVPALDAERADLLSQAIDALLERGIEVLVTLQPCCDVYRTRQQDRITVRARDLLLRLEELGDHRGAAEELFNGDHCGSRIPGLAWGGETGEQQVLDGLLSTDLPIDEICVSALLILCGQGTVSTVFGRLPYEWHRIVERFEEDYPHLGIQSELGTFRALDVSAVHAGNTLLPYFESLSQLLELPHHDAVALWFADALSECHHIDRACDFLSACASRSAVAAWIEDRMAELATASCPMNVLQMMDVALSRIELADPGIGAVRSWCLMQLEDRDAAIRDAQAVLAVQDCPHTAVLMASLVLVRCGGADEKQVGFDRLQSALVDGGRILPDGTFDVGEQSYLQGLGFWETLACCAAAEVRGVSAQMDLWQRCVDIGCDRQACALAAAWMVQDHCDESRDCPDRDLFVPAARYCIAFVRDGCYREGGSSGDTPLLHGSIGNCCVSAIENGGYLLVEKDRHHEIRDFFPMAQAYEYRLAEQRSAYLFQIARNGLGDPHDYAHRGRRSRGSAAVYDRIPTLQINMLGRFELYLGDERIQDSRHTRQKLKTLYGILALNSGRELTRDYLANAIWVYSDRSQAYKNLHNAWSQARQVLKLADGTCPYLVRLQSNYKMDSALVSTDVERMESLCRQLRTRPEVVEWLDILSELEQVYQGDLIPGEQDCVFIVRKRSFYRAMLVDALLDASAQLEQTDEHQAALWFAQAAYDHDRKREDVYYALMSTQLALGQRTRALDTYLECKECLREELGLSPSVQTTALYQLIIGDDVKPAQIGNESRIGVLR